MQSLQTTVLNKIQPGVVPIFIVSPNKNDGGPIASLLSHYLEGPGNGFQSNQSTNYFSTQEIDRHIHLIETEKFRNTDEDKDRLSFIFNKDFDNGILWGLEISYQTFFDLKIESLYPEAFYIFLYGKKIQKIKGFSINEFQLLNVVHDFCKDHQRNSILLHVNNTYLLGELIIQSLPVDIKAVRIYPKTNDVNYLPQSIQHIKYLASRDANDGIQKLEEDFDKDNFLVKNNKWFTGNDVLAILIANSGDTSNLLTDKIQRLLLSLLSQPFLYIICNSNTDSAAIKKLLLEKFGPIQFKVIVCENNVLACVNEIINDSGNSLVIVDHLNLSYSFPQLLQPFSNNSNTPVFHFGNIIADKIVSLSSGKLFLPDILTTRILLDNIAFERSTWKRLNGFDSQIGDKLMLWDFAIRALQLSGGYALESNAELSNRAYDPSFELRTISNSQYSEIIEKHKNLYSANLDQVLKLVSENQHIPQNEIITLIQKLNVLNGFLTHSKDEIRSLNDYSVSLQNRIRFLEGNRFYRWAERVNHYKKIFFKEKKPGRSVIKSILKFILFIFSKAGFGVFRTVLKRLFLKLYAITESRPYKIIYLETTDDGKHKSDSKHFVTYHDWITSQLDHSTIKKEYDQIMPTLELKPKISVIMPVYNPAINFLKEAIDSVIDQLYDNWELCIADDCSPNPQIKRLLNSYALKDQRIKVNFRTENGHISAASNSALELATGDYIMLMDHDDTLTPNCMFEFIKHLNKHPEDQLIYSDEDKVQHGNYLDPFFKPDFSPDKLLSTNYISHVVLIDKKIMDKVQGFRLGYEGSQDYDLMLRCSEETDKIGHITKILYHWRIHEQSVAGGAEAKPYAYIAAKKAIEAALVRRNIPGEVMYQLARGYYRIKYKIREYAKVSIIIPTKDAVKLTKNTIDSILALTEYPNYEIVVLNNNSSSKDFFTLMDEYKTQLGDRFKCVDAGFPFNFSKLMNVGAASSNGEYILMLNNDVEIIQKDWLDWMVSYTQHKRIGAVGVKLLFPDDTIQHAGVIIGLGNIRIAGHLFVGYHKDEHGYFNYIQTTSNYSALTAACLMCRRSVFEEVGGMDEYLEVEYNDIDFCLKILEKGYNNVYLADVSLYHYESATREHPFENKTSYARHLKEVEYFKEKWTKYINRDPYYNPNLSLDYTDCRLNLNETGSAYYLNK